MSPDPMKVLVTGAAGFIGSHLTERLLDGGWTVVGLDNLDPFYNVAVKRENLRAAFRNPSFRLVEGDIRDADLLDALASREEFDAIVHLAARAGVRPSLAEPHLYVDVNVGGTTRLLDAAVKHKIPKFVFASSSSVYGDRKGAPFCEDDPVDHPISPYAATKKAGELLCYTYHHLHGLAVSCLRFFTVYGPRQRPEMAIHKFIGLMEAGHEIAIFGDGRARRDFTYIDDVIDGVVAALERVTGYHIYNLGNCRTVELRDLVTLIGETLGKEPRIQNLPNQPGDVPLTCADISRASAELDYKPNFPIERGIQLFVEWFRDRESSVRA